MLDRRLHDGPAFGFLNLMTPVQVGEELSRMGTGWIPTQKTNIWGTQAVCFQRDKAFGLLEFIRRRQDDPTCISYDLMTLAYYAKFPQLPCCYQFRRCASTWAGGKRPSPSPSVWPVRSTGCRSAVASVSIRSTGRRRASR